MTNELCFLPNAMDLIMHITPLLEEAEKKISQNPCSQLRTNTFIIIYIHNNQFCFGGNWEGRHGKCMNMMNTVNPLMTYE